MDTYFISGISGIIGATLAILVNICIEQRNKKEKVSIAKFHMRMVLGQMKRDIDDAYRRATCGDIHMISPLYVFDGRYNYIQELCILRNELTEEDINVINQFFEDVKVFDNIRASVNYGLSIMNSDEAAINPYCTIGTKRNLDALFIKYRELLERFKKDDYYNGKLILLLEKLK